MPVAMAISQFPGRPRIPINQKIITKTRRRIVQRIVILVLRE
jgi:hypothetical protein